MTTPRIPLNEPQTWTAHDYITRAYERTASVDSMIARLHEYGYEYGYEIRPVLILGDGFDNTTEACRHCPTPDVHPTRIGGTLTYEGRCDPETCERHDHSAIEREAQGIPPSEALREALPEPPAAERMAEGFQLASRLLAAPPPASGAVSLINVELQRLLDAIEIMDQKITPYGEREDGTILHYIVADSTWHRILAAARGPSWFVERDFVAEATTPAEYRVGAGLPVKEAEPTPTTSKEPA